MARLRPLPPFPLLAMAFAVVMIGLSTILGVGYAVFHRSTTVELAETVGGISETADELAVVDAPASPTALP